MEQIIISMLGAVISLLGVVVALMLYLDRSRRADLAAHRDETQAGFARVNQRFDQLTDLIVDLARRVGRLEGRSEDQAEATEAR